ncbi:MAG: alpha/beta hydrolase-fold protein [Bacteroidales bacterium]
MKTKLLFILFLAASSLLCAQPGKGTKERIKIHSKSLEGNLIGDPADRDVTVYLPPSYLTQTDRRYPVLYMLHGYTDTDSKWFGWEPHWINLFDVIEASLAEGLSREMIVVMPNAYNTFKGSMYSSSVTIGDWETFVAKELVEYVDAHYRTLPGRNSRGLAGHSMGGYGTIRLGMKHPETWSSIYMMSACCMDGTMLEISPEVMKDVEAITAVDQLESASFGQVSQYALAAAWAPNPDNPPFFLDLPFDGEKVLPENAARIMANRTLYTVDQHVFDLKELKAIRFDVGDQDAGTASATALHEILLSNGIPHRFEVYEGDHLNRIAERIQTEVLPFFSESLDFE